MPYQEEDTHPVDCHSNVAQSKYSTPASMRQVVHYGVYIIII